MPRLLAFILCSLSLLACSTTSYNPTVYKWHLDQEALKSKPIKRIIIADVNVSGEPTRSILEKPAVKVDRKVEAYLKDHGFEIVSDHLFDNAWRQAIYAFGNFYDPTSGKVDRRGWQQVMASTLAELRNSGRVDAVLFTDVIEHDVQHSGGMQHYARWYGVTRKPATQGAGSGVPVGFDWGQTIKAASLMVTIYTVDGTPVFSSRGGLDTLHAIDLRRPDSGFVRRNKILNSTSAVEEGIELAFHPLIPMRKYPGKQP